MFFGIAIKIIIGIPDVLFFLSISGKRFYIAPKMQAVRSQEMNIPKPIFRIDFSINPLTLQTI